MKGKANASKKAQELKEAHEKNSETIRRSMLALLGFSLFCLMTTFGSADVSLLAAQATIQLPFADVPISFVGFLVAAPLLLIVLTIYLQIFVGYGRQLEAVRWYQGKNPEAVKVVPIEKLPTLFNLDSRVARLLTAFIFYWLVPLTLAAITWKAAARLEWGVAIGGVAVLVTLALVFLQIRRCPGTKRRWWNPPRWILLGFLCALPVLAGWEPELVHRPLNLFRVDLKKAWLPRLDLHRANLRLANLEGADLFDANLKEADLFRTNLQGARLASANLNGANLNGANLKGAGLVTADLQGASLFGTNLKGADLYLADLQGARLFGTKLQEAYLGGANLRGANLGGANLKGADLDLANLQGAILFGANLQGAKNLTQKQLDDACGDTETKLPPGRAIKLCPEKSK